MFGLPNLVLTQSTFSNCMRDLVFQCDVFQCDVFQCDVFQCDVVQARHACEQIT